MRAVIDLQGRLVVTAEDETEGYALQQWEESAKRELALDATMDKHIYRGSKITLIINRNSVSGR